MGKKTFFVHMPKTAGMAVKNAFINEHSFFPRYKDREHKFGVRNATRRGHISFDTPHWRSYLDNPDFSDSDVVFTVVRNPYKLLASYFFHDSHGTNKDDGWANVNGHHGFKTFEEFIAFYCTCDPKEWHVPMLNISLFSQMFDDSGKSLVQYAIRYESLNKGVSKFAKKNGLNQSTLKKLNVTERKEDYESLYNDNLRSMVAEKCKWDIETFGYDFSGPTDDQPILDVSDLEFYYKGPIL